MAAEPSYAELHDFAYPLAERASTLIRDGSAARWKRASDAEAKQNTVDLVTETDQAVENMIKSAIKERIGEESWAAGERDGLTDEFTWIVDPIDGTMNFVHFNPMVGCSIGVTHRSRPVVGVIAQPFMHRIFAGYLGGGAFMNRTTPLPLTGGIPQPLTELKQCLIYVEMGSNRSAEVMEKRATATVRLAGDPNKGVEGGQMCHAVRLTGSAVCSLASVLAGEADMFWHAGCWVWDVTAAACILAEIGGFLSGGRDAFARNAPIGEILMNRRYVAVRAVPATANETAEQIQKRIVKDLYETVDEWDP
ncbi:hypothetical protein Q5752_000830 [Cryptotrichosporon argae]